MKPWIRIAGAIIAAASVLWIIAEQRRRSEREIQNEALGSQAKGAGDRRIVVEIAGVLPWQRSYVLVGAEAMGLIPEDLPRQGSHGFMGGEAIGLMQQQEEQQGWREFHRRSLGYSSPVIDAGPNVIR